MNAVAPGPIWTPLIPGDVPPRRSPSFGADVPLRRAGQPEEVAPCYVFLASERRVLHDRPGAAPQRRHRGRWVGLTDSEANCFRMGPPV